jgi:hypothetical protein
MNLRKAEVVMLKSTATGKSDSKGTVCAFMRYSPDHAGNCYRMWDPLKKSIHITCDVQWLKWMYYSASKEPFKDDDNLQLSFNAMTFKDGKGNDMVSFNDKMTTINEMDSKEESSDDEQTVNEINNDDEMSNNSNGNDQNSNENDERSEDNNQVNEDANDKEGWQVTPTRRTRSGRTIKAPDRLIDRIGTAMGK